MTTAVRGRPPTSPPVPDSNDASITAEGAPPPPPGTSATTVWPLASKVDHRLFHCRLVMRHQSQAGQTRPAVAASPLGKGRPLTRLSTMNEGGKDRRFTSRRGTVGRSVKNGVK